VYLEDRMEPPGERAGRGRRPGPPGSIELEAGQLAAFVGDYYSDELDVVYKVELEGGRLTLAFAKSAPRPLQPIAPDALRAGNRTLRFEGDAADGFAGFQLDAGRVKNLRFVRSASAGR